MMTPHGGRQAGRDADSERSSDRAVTPDAVAMERPRGRSDEFDPSARVVTPDAAASESSSAGPRRGLRGWFHRFSISVRRLPMPSEGPARSGDGGAAPAESRTAPHLLRLARFLAAVCALCAAAAFPGSVLFNLETVVIRGNANVPASELLQRIGVGPGDSVFRVNAAAIRAHLRQDPRIADASVVLGFPRSLTVSVRERDPVAALAYGDGYVLLGADGVAIARTPGPGAVLPLVVDRLQLPWVQAGVPVPSPSVRLGVAVATTLPPDLRPGIIAVRVDPENEIVLEMRDGVLVEVGGAAGLAERLAMVSRVLAAVRARGIQAQYVDLRVPGSIIVMPVDASPTDHATSSPGPGVPAAEPATPEAAPADRSGQENPLHRGIQVRPPYLVPP